MEVGLGFLHHAGGGSLYFFFLGLLKLQINGEIYDRGIGQPILPRVQRDLEVVSRGNCRSALASLAPGNQQQAGFHTMLGDIDQEGRFFRPQVVGVGMYGRLPNPGMGLYPPLS